MYILTGFPAFHNVVVRILKCLPNFKILKELLTENHFL